MTPTTLLPTRARTSSRFAALDEYPNTMTLESVNAEIQERIADGYDALDSFRQVAEGVGRWAERERAEG